ncbi:MAG: flagellar filament capping protein FliD [Thermodesulfobacteriota bacterium]|nr:flagellar filament capping protein FliD [Thermodesulfobacteriota bacterium]
MSGVTFGGLATGLPTDDIVTQLMELERRPLDRLEKQKETEATRLQAFKQLDTRLDDLREAVGGLNITSEVRTSSISLSSEDAFTASSDGAASGSYDVAVSQLAQVQKTVSGGLSSQTDAVLGSGTFSVGDETITIDDSNNSLIGLAESINALSESTGVQATIINDGRDANAYHLVLTGEDATISFATSSNLEDAGGTPINLNLTETRSAQQAVAIVDGIRVESDSNTLTGVIAGVTLHLGDVSSTSYTGTPETGVEPLNWADPPVYDTTLMTVEPGTDTLKEKLDTFVSSYNEVMNWISAGYAEFGATAPTAQEIEDGAEDLLSDVVRGDSTVNGVKRQLQSLLSSVVDGGSMQVLSQLGISTQKDGSIDLNEATLDTALETDFDGVVGLLAGRGETDGVMKKFNTTLLQLTGAGSGMYAEKQDRYDSTIRRLDEQILRTEPLLAKKEETMRARFSAMELIVSGLNAQSSFLTQQMDMLNNMMTGN